MYFTNYNVPEGYGYNFEEMEKTTTYEERFDFLMRSMNNSEVVYAKVKGYDDEGRVLYLDFGHGIMGLCEDNWSYNPKVCWLNKYLVGHIVNVKLKRYERRHFNNSFAQKRCV